MKFSARLMVTTTTFLLLGAATAANAMDYTVPDVDLSAPGGDANTAPGPTMVNGDTLTFKAVWFGHPANPPGHPAADAAGVTTTSWYFNTPQTNSRLENTFIANNFSTFSANLYWIDSLLVDHLVTSFLPGYTPLVLIANAGNYRIDVMVDTTGAIQNQQFSVTTSLVPLPAAAWLLLSGVVGLGAMARRRKVASEA